MIKPVDCICGHKAVVGWRYLEEVGLHYWMDVCCHCTNCYRGVSIYTDINRSKEAYLAENTAAEAWNSFQEKISEYT